MPAFIIGYDLRRPGQNYEELFEAIRALGTWWHCLDSTWIVVSGLTEVAIRDNLGAHIDGNDKLFVCRLPAGAWATRGMDTECNDWLRANV